MTGLEKELCERFARQMSKKDAEIAALNKAYRDECASHTRLIKYAIESREAMEAENAGLREENQRLQRELIARTVRPEER